MSDPHDVAALTAELASAGFLEESAEDLYENAPCGYFSTTPDGRIVKVNQTFLDWTGYRRDELVEARRFADLLAPGDRIFHETHYAPLLEMQGAVREIAVELVCADATRLPVLVNATLRRNEDGVPRVIRTTVFNAAERREYERELVRERERAESRSRSALALEHVMEGVLLVDANGKVELLNAAGLALLRVDASVYGGDVGSAIPGWNAIAGRVPVGEPGRWPAPAALPLGRGEGELWVAVAGVDSGDGIVYTIRDITAERRLDEIRDDIVAIASHELRTPLAGVVGAAKTLLEREKQLGAEMKGQLLVMVVEQSERLTRIVDELLLTSNLDAGLFQGAEAAFDAAAVAERAAAVVAGARGVAPRLRLDLEPGVTANADPAHTEQVLVSVIDNAVAYSPPASTVSVTVHAHRNRARFLVEDEGPGIPLRERGRVFEKFYRLDPDQLGGVGGAGLGLYIARELVERMNGRIEIAPRDGPGTTVVVDLPLAR